MSYVIKLAELGMDDVDVVGGKNASLGEMIRNLRDAGVDVPGGFATTAAAYRAFLATDGLDERIGEVLKVRAGDVSDQKIILYDPKSGKESEAVYIPKKVAERLKEYISAKNLSPNERIFPFGYSRARDIVIEAGRLVNIQLKSHDLRRHAATYASRSGTPIEIVSKVILRHANLATTQRYLGKITDVEAVRWIENLYS